MGKQLPFCHTVSKLFQPQHVLPVGAQVKNELLSKSYKLMVDEGVIAPSANGFFHLLPLATKALEKLTRLVDQKMANIGAQKISCPTLTGSGLWEKTGRLAMAGAELFKLEDRHDKNYILSPTHEESLTQLLSAQTPLSYKQLPLLLYQMTNKFRDEKRPRFGLIRAREFFMKDLYSFDTSAEACNRTYEMVQKTYHDIFEEIGVDYIKVKGLSGVMGGDVSHEYHYPAPIGDDTLRLCKGCNHGWNKETNEKGACSECGSEDVAETKGIEVGHMFQLGTRYSEPLEALYNTAEGTRQPLVMASYGIGLTRILAASLEVMSLPDQLRWPPLLAPYTLLIITPKEGSKESNTTHHLPEQLYWDLQRVPALQNNVIIDDRSQMTIGKRLAAARRTGYPLVAVVGKAAATVDPKVELINTATGHTSLHSPGDLADAVVGCNQRDRMEARQ